MKKLKPLIQKAKTLVQNLRKYNLKKYLRILTLSIGFFTLALGIFLLGAFTWATGRIIWENWVNPNVAKMEPKYFFLGISIFAGLLILIWRSLLSEKNNHQFIKQIENQNQKLKKELITQKSQQFLDSLKLFENSQNIEVKKGALFHLEHLALEFPAYRQRCVDFLCSLNDWMSEYINYFNEQSEQDWRFWRNEKVAFEEINKGQAVKGLTIHSGKMKESREKQLISMEVSGILEKIIKQHCQDIENKTTNFILDFNLRLLPVIDFSNLIFPKKSINFTNTTFFMCNFEKTEFLGDIDFYQADFIGKVKFLESKFRQKVNFTKTRFARKANFIGCQFSDEVNFCQSEFLSKANFLEAVFYKKTDFAYSKFHDQGNFLNVKFASEVSFVKAKFHKKMNFNKIDSDKIKIEKKHFSFLRDWSKEENSNKKDKVKKAETTETVGNWQEWFDFNQKK